MTSARQLIDSDEFDDGDLEADLAERKSIIGRLKFDPDFKRRMENPRQAKRGDIVKIITRMRSGVEIRYGSLYNDAIQVNNRHGKSGTEFWVMPPDRSFGKRLSTGTGTSFWADEPGPWGVQRVEVIGSDFVAGPRYWFNWHEPNSGPRQD